MLFSKSAVSDVIYVGRSDDMVARLQSCFQSRNLTVSRKEPLEVEKDGLGADDLVAVFVEVSSSDDLKFIKAISAGDHHERRIVAVLQTLDSPIVRDLVRLGISDLITRGMSDQEILHSLDAIKADRNGPHHVLAFTPVLGGMGSTTLAIETAILLARNGRSSSCLVDLDFYAGECADFLNVSPRLEMDVLNGDEARIDEHLLDLVLSDTESGIKLLAAQTRLGSSLEVNPKTVLRLLDMVSSSFENVIVDLPRAWFAWSDEVVLGCDYVLLITDSTVPSLKAARRQLDEFAARFGDRAQMKIIVNRAERGLFRSSAGEDDFRRSFGEAYVGSISDDTKIARLAVDSGMPISKVKSGSRIIKDLSDILSTLIKKKK